jgi:tRNA(Ile)-lysidine synthase
MLRAMLEIKQQCGGSGSLYVAHLHHGWRGKDADADEAWLAELCHKLGVELRTGRADTVAIAAEDGDGLEAAARKARYDFLTSAAEKLGARYVAVAHTADDQVETVLHRILRGTGVEGLAGMPFTRPLSPAATLVRPLLTVQRRELLAYLSAIGQDYRTDPTNADVRWTRNRLRHELLPGLRRQFNANVDQALLRLAAQAGETQAVMSQLAEKLADGCVHVQRPTTSEKSTPPVVGLSIDCRLLGDQPPLLVREVCKLAWKAAGWPLQSMGFDEWRQLSELVQGVKQEAVTLPANIRARRENDMLQLRPVM